MELLSAQKVSTQQHWAWYRETHWKNWHGIWTLWYPRQSLEAVKQYRLIRAIRPDDDGAGKRVFQRNQWYSLTGPELGFGSKAQAASEWSGPWTLNEEEHSCRDGILHPTKDNFRIFQFPTGDLAWLQLKTKPNDPKSIVFGEVHFVLPGKEGKITIAMGYGENQRIGVAQILEEARETDERPPPEWQGTVFKHYGLQPLEACREKPAGEFVGQEMVLTPALEMTTYGNVVWPGFGNEDDSYTTAHFPLGFTGILPSEPATGKQLEFRAHWVIDEYNVKMISWTHDENGKLVHAKLGKYSSNM